MNRTKETYDDVVDIVKPPQACTPDCEEKKGPVIVASRSGSAYPLTTCCHEHMNESLIKGEGGNVEVLCNGYTPATANVCRR